jgi:bifunctional non-homologous end joining protein LigD
VGLAEYDRKRKFENTPEPAPTAPAVATGNAFVVQKHDATRLHYDFRLEIDGVLVSWAVPKGPSLNPKDKRLAVQTEDHPLDYLHFEGVIPEGNYGAGPVEVWDTGTYEMEGTLSAAGQLARGELKFKLHGRKLRGSFALVHTGKRAEDPKDRKNWLLIKHADETADPHWDIERLDWSVLSGRTLKEIEAGLATHAGSPADLPGARKAPMPDTAEPTLATLIEKPFTSPDWVFEVKWDGMRVLSWIRDGKAALRSRRNRDVTPQFPELADLPARIASSEAIVDGEAVVLDEQGRPGFELMQQRMNVACPSQNLIQQAPVIYYAFDLLYCDGYDLRDVPLIERKNFLRRILIARDPVRYSEHIAAEGEQLYRLAKERGLEGIIGKHIRSKYSAGRSSQWVKLKTTSEVDAVIGGFTAPRGSREHFGALLLGLYEGPGLHFIGGVGSGFNQGTQQAVRQQLEPLITPDMPFAMRPQTREQATWVKPQLMARVKFSEWTGDHHLRTPVFLGLRNDLDPQECTFTKEPPRSYADEITAAKGATLTLDVEGRSLTLTNLNKVFFPEPGLTKRDLLAYYARVADLILPFLRERPLVMRRMPDGVTGELFYQKEVGSAMPPWIDTAVIPTEGKNVRYAVCNNLASLLWLTHLGCIDHDPWSSRVDNLDHPDYLFLDLDPTTNTPFSTVVEVAREACAVLDEAGMKFYPKISGATGFHIFVPLDPVYTYEQATTFSEIVSRIVASRVPDKVTFQRIVAKRPPGRVLLDYQQLSWGRPLAAVYSVRPEPLATVSAPVSPGELKPSLKPEQFTLTSMSGRLKKVGDLWADFWQSRQRLEPALARLRTLPDGRGSVTH